MAPRSAAVALLAAMLVLSWQSLTVRRNYGGNWTALYCTGDYFRVPPALAGEHIYIFPHSRGWDGQFYHYMAHDPFMTRGLSRYCDTPVLRYRRILAPALAWLAAFGNDRYVDIAYEGVILFFFALGTYWLSRLAAIYGRSGWWGLAFLMVPAAIVSVDRLAVDVALAAFVAGFALYSREERAGRQLYLVLMLAPLARETGLLLAAAYCLWLLLRKRMLRCAVFATSVFPALAWFKYVDLRTPPFIYTGTVALPLSGVIDRLVHPIPYPGYSMVTSLIRAFDDLAVAGIVLAFVLAFFVARQMKFDAQAWAIILFALLGVFFWRPTDWPEVTDYGRILSPLLMLLALEPLSRREPGLRRWIAAAPLCMIAPRCALQIAPQALAVMGLTGWFRRL